MGKFTTEKKALSKQSILDRLTPLQRVTIKGKSGGESSYEIKFKGKVYGGPEEGPAALEPGDSFSQNEGMTVITGGVQEGAKDAVIYDGDIVEVNGNVSTTIEQVGTFPIWGLSAVMGGVLAVAGLFYSTEMG